MHPASVQNVPFIEYEQGGVRRTPRLKAQYGQPYAIEELFYKEYKEEVIASVDRLSFC